MFVVSDAEAAAIRAVYEQRGEFAAAIELRRLFPGVTDNAQARECARTIAGWRPLRPVKRCPRRRGYGGSADTGRLLVTLGSFAGQPQQHIAMAGQARAPADQIASAQLGQHIHQTLLLPQPPLPRLDGSEGVKGFIPRSRPL